MAGYSGTPLAQKLGITAESSVTIIGAPRGFSLVKKKGRAPFDVALVFPASRAALVKTFASAARAMKEDGGVWIAWPKKSSIRRIETDVTENAVRELLLPFDERTWVDNKICAIDETYSGLRFVKRKERRVR